MTLTLQHREELLHRAFICAIASEAGVNLCLGREEFDYGIDGNFSQIVQSKAGKLSQGGAKLEFQLKASSNVSVRDKHVSCTIKIDAYNKLVHRACDGVPVMLIVLALPKESDQWMAIGEDEMTLRKCCYWRLCLDLEPSTNSDKVAVKIPRNQILKPKDIVDVLEKIQQANISKAEEYRKFLTNPGGVR